MGIKQYHIYVNGLVQGVGYRASTLEQAQQRDLSGWVQNRPDGRVEIAVQGEDNNLQSFIAWCRKGPGFAQVAGLEINELATDPSLAAFHIRR